MIRAGTGDQEYFKRIPLKINTSTLVYAEMLNLMLSILHDAHENTFPNLYSILIFYEMFCLNGIIIYLFN